MHIHIPAPPPPECGVQASQGQHALQPPLGLSPSTFPPTLCQALVGLSGGWPLQPLPSEARACRQHQCLQGVPTKLSLYVWLGPLGVCGVMCVPLSNPGWCEPSGCLMGSLVQSGLCATRQEKPVSSQHPKRPDSQRPMHYPKTPL